jgi:hypothetical protein
MAHSTLKLTPGVDVIKTPTLNEAALSSTNLIRFMPDRNNLGLVQKWGGWVAYLNYAYTGTIRALKGWSDLNALNHLAVGAENSLSILNISGSNVSFPSDITPQVFTTDTAPNFSTTAYSNVVSVIDSNITASVLDYVNYVTPVSVGGMVLTGPYKIQTASGNSYTIFANSLASSTVSNGGASYTFSATSGSSIVKGYLADNTYAPGGNFYVGVPTSVGGLTLFGLYLIIDTPATNGSLTAGQFTFSAANTASSTQASVAINGGLIDATFYIAIGPQPAGTGFGIGGFGQGGFGSGTSQPSVPGTPIMATDWSLDNFGENLVANPTGGAIYSWSPEGQTQNAQIVGQFSPLVNDGIFVAMPQRQIVAWGSSFTLQPDPMLIRWSDVEDSSTWIGTATNQAGSYRIPTGSQIVTCLQGPQQGLIWTDLDVWAMQYIGPPLVYGFNKIGSNCGAISRKCVGQLGNVIYWMSQKQFFVNAGDGPKPLPCPVWDVIFQNLLPGNNYNGIPYTQNIRCAVNSQFNEVMWFYPSVNGVGENDSYVKYNTVLNQWDFGSDTSSCSVGRTAWIDQSVLGPPIGSGTDNFLYQHEIGYDAASGSSTLPMPSSMQTGFFSIAEGDQIMFVDQIWPDMKWGTYSGDKNATVYMTLYWTNYATDATVSTGSYSGAPSNTVYSDTFPMTQSTEYISCRIRARLIAISLSSQDTGTFWRLGGIRYRAAPDGKY